MKRLFSLLIVPLVLAAAGCQNQHVESRKELSERWNKTRVQMAVKQARQQFDSGQLELALRTVQRAAEIDPDYVPAYLLVGQIYLEQGYLGPAQKHLEHCLEIDPCNAPASYNLGVVYERRGILDKAFDCYEFSWQKHPERSAYVLAMAEMYVGRQEYRTGLDILEEYISGSTHGEPNPSVYLAAGNINLMLKKPEAAVSCFRSACNLAPDDDRLTESLAYALMASGDYKEALRLFERLQRRLQDEGRKVDWAHALALGDCYMKMGKNHQALRCYQQVSDEAPSNPAVWNRMARTALAREDYQRAQMWARKAMVLDDDNTEARLILGFTAFQKHRYHEVETIMNEVLVVEPENTVAWCLLGQAYQAQEKNQEAMQCYGKALQIDPKDAFARRCLANLDNVRISLNPGIDSH